MLRAMLVGVTVAIAAGADGSRTIDDTTFRPTVLVCRGTARGSGTVIASVDDETLILTAAHVLEADGPITIELHRYNLGVEATRSEKGWPKKIPAELVTQDRAADVALVRIRGMVALQYVAKLAILDDPVKGDELISLGIDHATKLSSWRTTLRGMATIDLQKGGGERLFIVTEKPPDFGRSGGGLYNKDWGLVGVCVGRVEFQKGRRDGIFASCLSLRRLIGKDEILSVIADSDEKHGLIEKMRIDSTRSKVAGTKASGASKPKSAAKAKPPAPKPPTATQATPKPPAPAPKPPAPQPPSEGGTLNAFLPPQTP